MSVEFTPGFLLHTRKYTDSRILLEVFTQEYGIVSGVYRLKSSKKKPAASLPYCTVLHISWLGRSNLKTFTDIEYTSAPARFLGNALYITMYLNELLLRLLPKEDSYADVYLAYDEILKTLSQHEVWPLSELEALLRTFELHLLNSMGYGLSFTHDIDNNAISESSQNVYRLDPQQGFFPVLEQSQGYTGQSIVAMAKGDFSDAIVRRDAKRLCRTLLQPLLGDKPLKSRELFLK